MERSARSSFPAIPFGAYPSPIPIASGPTSGAFRKSVHALLYQRYYSQFAAGWAHSFEIPRKRYQTALPVEHFFVCCLQLAVRSTSSSSARYRCRNARSRVPSAIRFAPGFQ